MVWKVDTPQNATPRQNDQDTLISKRKAGRPTKPNMKRYDLKLDAGIHAQLLRYAASTFSSKSAVVNQALREFFYTHKIQQ